MKLFRRFSRKSSSRDVQGRRRAGSTAAGRTHDAVKRDAGEGAVARKKSGRSQAPSNRTLLHTGYATKGTVIARIIPATRGHEGKNVFGETLPSRPPYEPRVLGGAHIRAEGNSFKMDTDGKVQVYRDDRGTYYLEGKPYRRGRARIRVPDDEMKAYLTVTPPVGGARAVTPEEVLEICREDGVVYGIQENAIKQTLEHARRERIAISDVVIARGTEPVNGRDGQIEFKVPLATGTAFKLREDGSVDFKEHDNLTTVEQGTLIAVVYRAEEGRREGTTVRGERIPSRQGENVRLEAGEGVQVGNTEEGQHYIAQTGGRLVVQGEKISVEPLLVIRGDVGPRTGNITFNGGVVVHGSVLDGYRVRADRSVTVNGNVGCCRIRSGGNILVKNGVIGKGEGLVAAKGDVFVKFAENANIRAGGTIHINRAALNCRMIAGGRILANKEKGQLVGGELRAREGLDVKVLGNGSEHRTEVHAGKNFMLALKLREVERRLELYRRSLKSMLQVMERIKESAGSGPLSERAGRAYREARTRGGRVKLALERLTSLRLELIQGLRQVHEAEVVVRDTVYPGVSVHFGDEQFSPEQAQTRVRLRYDQYLRKIQREGLVPKEREKKQRASR